MRREAGDDGLLELRDVMGERSEAERRARARFFDDEIDQRCRHEEVAKQFKMDMSQSARVGDGSRHETLHNWCDRV